MRISVRLILLLLSCAGARSQPALAEFDAASVKRASGAGRSGTFGGPGTSNPGYWNCENQTLSSLIGRAYQVKFNQVVGPAWLEQERYNIEARIAPGTTKQGFALMLQNLLQQRFKLVVRKDQKEMAVYRLVVARGGPKFAEPAPAPAEPGSGAKTDQTIAMDKEGYPILRPGGPSMAVVYDRVSVRATEQSMERFAGMLSTQVGRPVIDDTGLKGTYDFTLHWKKTPHENASGDTSDSEPTIFSALQDQLGLKLDSAKSPVDVLVVERAEKIPVEN
jgi:uncharacterized protein (TIGR03435 family)